MGTEWNDRFKVHGPEPVLFKITVGHGQIGVSTVHFDNVEKGTGHDYPMTVPIARADDDVDRKRLDCTTTPLDVRAETNTVGVDFEISQGSNSKKRSLEQQKDTDGNLGPFTATIILENER
jgi:hypothetical protein